MTDLEIVQHIALSMHEKVGPVTAKMLISYCGGIEYVFEHSKDKLRKIPGIGESFVSGFNPGLYLKQAEKEFEHCKKNDITPLVYTQSTYPRRLNYFEYSPIVLYYKGNANLNHHRTTAFVGTRNPSDYGKQMCERIIDELKAYDVLLISGLAYGIDATAHRQSVLSNIPTLGVMGHGHDRIYPRENESLSKKMIKGGGGLLTEFPIGTRPDRENFPMRNRIIAALSDVIVVVESKRSGGSIITAEYGNEYNKDVFAIPGQINHELSEGCNKLIKQNKAHLLESAADISYIMRWDEMDAGKVIQTQLFVELDEKESLAMQIIRDNREIAIDNLTYKMDISTSEVSSILLTLEFKGLIRSLPGKKYTLI